MAIRRHTACPARVIALLGIVMGWAGSAMGQVEYYGSDQAAGTSLAVAVRNRTLLQTSQILPTNSVGEIVEQNKQIAQTFHNVRTAIQAAHDSDFQLIKLNVSAKNDAVVQQVQQYLAKTNPTGNGPAVAFVVSQLPQAEAIVAMDAIAAIDQSNTDNSVARVRSSTLPGRKGFAHVSMTPPGRMVYISGQAASGSLAEATRLTMEGLHKTLEHFHLQAEHVVQVKTFLTPISEAEIVNAEIAKFYSDGLAPPVTHVEWVAKSPIEIEIVAFAPASPSSPPLAEPVRYVTPPWMTSSPVFSRVAVIERGRRVYVSGMLADRAAGPGEEIRAMFAKLDRVLKQAGTDMRHLVKATYYVTEDETSRHFGKIRQEVYDPQRPPAASKAAVTSVGFAGRTISLDMIAVTPPKSK